MTELKETVENDTLTQTEPDNGVPVVEQQSSQDADDRNPTERINDCLKVYPFLTISLQKVEDLNTKNGTIVRLCYHKSQEPGSDPDILITDGVMIEGDLDNNSFSQAVAFLTKQLPKDTNE